MGCLCRTPGLHSSPSTPRCLAPPRKPPAFGPLPAPPESGRTLAQLTLPAKPPGFKPHTWRGGGGWGGGWLCGLGQVTPRVSAPGSLAVPDMMLRASTSRAGVSREGAPTPTASRAEPGTQRLMKSFLYCHPALPRGEPGMLLGPQFSRYLMPADCGCVCLSPAGAALAGHMHTLPQHPGHSSSSAQGADSEFVVCEAQLLGKIASPLHPYPGLPASRPGIPSKSRRAAHCTVAPADKLGDEGTFRERLLQGDERLCRNRLSPSARARLASQQGRCQPPWWWKWLLVALRTFRPHSRSPKALQPRPRPLGSEGRLRISQARGGPGTGRPLLTEPVCVWGGVVGRMETAAI